jgi:hypothetical protein
VSLSAVQSLLQSELQDWHTPAMDNAGIGPLNAFIAPPQAYVSTLTRPAVYIWGEIADGHRTTAPSTPTHSGGFKRMPWEIDLWLMFVGSAAPEDKVLPILIDAIRWIIETTPYPQTLNDPDSMPPNTQLVAIGEEIRVHQELPEAIEDQANLLLTARMRVTVIEDYQS